VEVTVVDDSRVQDLRVGLYDIVCLLRDHTSRTSIFRVNYKQRARSRNIHQSIEKQRVL
jgi:hypothetical protein